MAEPFSDGFLGIPNTMFTPCYQLSICDVVVLLTEMRGRGVREQNVIYRIYLISDISRQQTFSLAVGIVTHFSPHEHLYKFTNNACRDAI